MNYGSDGSRDSSAPTRRNYVRYGVLTLGLLAFFFVAQAVLAVITLTVATGGSAISADTTGGAYTALTGPIIAEGATADIGTGTIILNVPSGFTFDTGGTAPTVLVTRTAGGGNDTRNINDLASGSTIAVTRTSTQLTITITAATSNSVKNSLTWQNVRVRPSAGTPLASGNITKTGTSNIANITNGVTNLGTLTEVAGAATKLVFSTAPGSAVYGSVLAPQPVVKSQDQFNNNSASGLGASKVVTLTLSSGTGLLQGTVALDIGTGAGNGTATYSGLSVSAAGAGKVLTAAASLLTSTVSTAFTISALPAVLTGTRPYDGTANAAYGILSVANKIGSDTVTVASGSGTLVSANAGARAITSFGTLALGGSEAGNYTLTGGSGSVTITKLTPTISVTNSPVTYTGSPQDASVLGSVTGTVSNIKYNGSGTVPVNAGTYTVTADFLPSDSTNYNSLTGASAGSFAINKATPTLSVTNSPVTYDGAAHAATVSCQGGGASSNILTGGAASQTNAGTYAVTADCAASANYSAAMSASAGSFVINQASQTITFNALPDKTMGDPDFTVNATASSGLILAFTSLTTGVCTVSTNTVHLVSSGTCTIRASQGGNANYTAAANVDRSFSIGKITPTISVTNSPVTYTGSSQAATITGSVTGTVSNIKYNGSGTAPTNVGTYVITADFLPNDTATYTTLTGASAGDFVINPANPLPTITSLSPSEATAGSTGFTLIVQGTGFISSSTVLWNGTSRTTTYVSATEVSVAVLSADIATASSSILVAVQNPAPGGGTSNAQVFAVISAPNNPVPTIVSVSPNTKTAGDAGFVMTIFGTGFIASSTVQVNGVARATSFSSATELTISFAASELVSATSYSIIVENPAPGGGTSSAAALLVTAVPTNPVPHISSLSSSTATAGDAGFTLTIFGTDFIASSTAHINGTGRTTTFVSVGQLLIDLLSSDLLSAMTSSITVENPAPGGGTSNAATFAVLAPASAPAAGETGAPAGPTTVMFTGHAFPGAVVKVVGRNVSFDLIDTQQASVTAEGAFRDTFTSTYEGVHSFALSIKDRDGRATQSKFFTIDTTSSHTFEVLVPPTIEVSPSVVRRGDGVTITGYATPNTVVHTEVDTVPQADVTAKSDGSYQVSVSSSTFNFGRHDVRVRQSERSGRNMSDYSLSQTFTISTVAVPSADLNGDGVINVQDLGIFFSRRFSTDSAVRATVDFNSDGKADLSDFSILIRAMNK